MRARPEGTSFRFFVISEGVGAGLVPTRARMRAAGAREGRESKRRPPRPEVQSGSFRALKSYKGGPVGTSSPRGQEGAGGRRPLPVREGVQDINDVPPARRSQSQNGPEPYKQRNEQNQHTCLSCSQRGWAARKHN